MSMALILIPHPPALSGEHDSDGKQPCHLPGFEDSALRIHEGDAVAAKLEPAREIGGTEHPAS
jgi:hypothetical protein